VATGQLKFNVQKGEECAKRLSKQSDSLKKVTDKLKRSTEDTKQWWGGSSKNSYLRKSNELIALMYKTVDVVKEMSEDMKGVAKAKKEEEQQLTNDLKKAMTLTWSDVGAGAGGSGGSGSYSVTKNSDGTGTSTASGTGGFPVGSAKKNFEDSKSSPWKFDAKAKGGSSYTQQSDNTKWVYDAKTGALISKKSKSEKDKKSGFAGSLGMKVVGTDAKASYAGAETYGKGEYMKGSAGAYFGYAQANAGAGVGIFTYKDGKVKFEPGAYAQAGASAMAGYAQAEGRISNDYIGAYGKADASLLKVGAEGKVAVGMVDGKFNAGIDAKAQALVAEVGGTAGVSVCGVDVGVSGSVNFGVGVQAKVGFTDGKVSVNLGASLGIGASVGFEVDVGAMATKAVSGVKAGAAWVGGLFK
jgi:uncharacterized protein YukE